MRGCGTWQVCCGSCESAWYCTAVPSASQMWEGRIWKDEQVADPRRTGGLVGIHIEGVVSILEAALSHVGRACFLFFSFHFRLCPSSCSGHLFRALAPWPHLHLCTPMVLPPESLALATKLGPALGGVWFGRERDGWEG